MSIFKTYKLLLPLIICTLITLGMAMYLLSISSDLPDETENDTPRETETEVTEMEIPVFTTDLSAYESYMDAPSGSFLILVNKQNTIGTDDKPADLISVKDIHPDEIRDLSLDRTAEMALEAMFIEMRAAGFKNVFVTSAYRSYSKQSDLFEGYIVKEMNSGSLSREQAIEKVLRYSAYPGTSEHQTGLCVDLMTYRMSDLDESFADEPVYDWLLENAWKFGFILRFPEDKTDITGYDFEPWHYRFVGRYDAYMIHAQNLCLEEYIEQIN